MMEYVPGCKFEARKNAPFPFSWMYTGTCTLPNINMTRKGRCGKISNKCSSLVQRTIVHVEKEPHTQTGSSEKKREKNNKKKKKTGIGYLGSHIRPRSQKNVITNNLLPNHFDVFRFKLFRFTFPTVFCRTLVPT